MNIFELLYIVLVCAVGYISGKFLSLYIGVTGWILGFPLGCFLMIFAYMKVSRLISQCNENDLPICKNGKCKTGDYDIVDVTENGTIFCCNCGTRYLCTKRYFSEILSDGTTKPYLKKNSKGYWEPDIEDDTVVNDK